MAQQSTCLECTRPCPQSSALQKNTNQFPIGNLGYNWHVTWVTSEAGPAGGGVTSTSIKPGDAKKWADSPKDTRVEGSMSHPPECHTSATHRTQRPSFPERTHCS